MGDIKIEGVTHWSIPVNDIEESERFYGELLGLDFKARLGNSIMTCFNVGDHNILLCEVAEPMEVPSGDRDVRAHHAFTVSPETFDRACKVFKEENVTVVGLTYRARGVFCGREMYFLDPSGNRLELRDPTWVEGMPEPSYEELANA